MSEALVVGIIADTSSPLAAARLLGDLAQLAAEDPGLSRLEVVVLENPSGEPAPQAEEELRACGLAVHRFGRAAREAPREAPRGAPRVGPAEGHSAGRPKAPLKGRRAELTREAGPEPPPGRLPIAAARALVQRRAFEQAGASGAAVWLLDEDLRLSPLLEAISKKGEPPLSARVERLRDARVDVAIGPVLGAPPLPARSTVRVNLEDALRHLDALAALHPRAAWPDRSAENALVRRALPEYYYDLARAHEDAGARPMWLERAGAHETAQGALARLADAMGGLIEGTPITRPLTPGHALSAGASPLARGGNTLVLQPALLGKIPSVAPLIGGRVSRRSDMLWARLAAALEGARFELADLPTLQDRSGPGRSSFAPDKLLDDMRGSAVVAALDALLAEGALARRGPPPRDAVLRAVAVYVARAEERLAAVQRSEARARLLLDQLMAQVGPRGERPGHLGHPAHAASLDTLAGHAARLREAYEAGLPPWEPAGDQADVERFFLDLPGEIEAHRAALCAEAPAARLPEPPRPIA